MYVVVLTRLSTLYGPKYLYATLEMGDLPLKVGHMVVA